MFLALILCACVVVLALILAFQYASSKSDYGVRVARRQVIWLLTLLSVPALAFPILYYLLPQTWRTLALALFQGGLALYFLAGCIVLLARRARAGAVLLDLEQPASPYRRMFLFVGAMYLILALIQLLTLDGDDVVETLGSAASIFFWLSFGITFIVWGSTRFQIRQRGILNYQQFTPWEKIRGYEWEQGAASALTLRVRSWSPLAREYNLLVPVRYRNNVDALLHFAATAPA